MQYQVEELILLVQRLSEKYTGKASTSVTYETAEQLLEAVIYCIYAYDHAGEWNPEAQAVSETTGITAAEAYSRGYALVLEKLKSTEELYHNLMQDFDSYGSRAYQDTIVAGIPEFFKWYDPILNPQNHILLLDYPILVDLQDKKGVDCIYHYLQCIQQEQTFLGQFPKDYIQLVLYYDNKEYEEFFDNIVETVLKNVLLNQLLGYDKLKLQFDSNDREKLRSLTAPLPAKQLTKLLSDRLQAFMDAAKITDRQLMPYLQYGMSNIAQQLPYKGKQ